MSAVETSLKEGGLDGGGLDGDGLDGDGQNETNRWMVDPIPLIVGSLALLMYLGSELYFFSGRLAFPLDDSWIHLQFARQIALGEGLSYNSGTLVAGSTSPLWTALLSIFFLLPGSPFWGAKLLGSAFFLMTIDVTGRLALELGLTRGLSRLAATLVASSHWLVWSALSGMEISLFTCLSLWAILLHLRRRPISLVVMALSCLARPEGFLLLAAALFDRLLASRRGWRREMLSLVGPLIGALLVVGPTLLFFRWIGDSFLPTTFAVKGNPDPTFIPQGRYLRAVLDIFFRSQPIMILFAGAGALRLFERWGGRRDKGLLTVFWTFGLPFAYSLLAVEKGPVVVGNFGRYYFPLIPAVVLLGVLGWQRPTLRLMGSIRLALVVLVLVPPAWGLASGPLRYVQTLANVEESDVAASRWLTGLLDRSPPEVALSPEAPIAVQDIGAIKYLLPNPVIDLVGIVNPDILPRLRTVGWQRHVLEYLAQRQPAYLVVFPEFFPDLVRVPGFRRVQAFPIKDNVTMAGDELVIFSTPWTKAHLPRQDPTP